MKVGIPAGCNPLWTGRESREDDKGGLIIVHLQARKEPEKVTKEPKPPQVGATKAAD